MRTIWLPPILVLALAGCSFKSQLSVKVQVYDGYQLKPVETPPDYAAVADEAASILAECTAADEQIELLANAADRLAKAYAKTRTTTIDALVTLSETEEYKVAAAKYRSTWTKTAEDLAGAATAAERQKYLISRRSAFFDDPAGQSRFLAGGLDVEPILRKRLVTALSEDKLLLSLTVSIGDRIPENRIKQMKHLAANSDRDYTALKQEVQQLQDWFVVPQDDVDAMRRQTTRDIEPTDNVVQELRAAQRATLRGPLAAVANACGTIVARARQLGRDANALPSEERDQKEREMDNAIEALMKATQEFASAADSALNESDIVRFVKEWRELLSNFSNLGEDLAVLIAAAPEEVQAELLQIPPDESIDLPALKRRYSSFARAATKSFKLSREISSRQNALVYLARSQPFRIADPNLATISHDDGHSHWLEVPLDELVASGDGLAQYIIVQDGPTSYRLKELHVDPTSVVGLQITIADVGVELLTKAAAIASGVDLSSVLSRDGQKEPSPPASLGADLSAARERELNEVKQATLRDLLAKLRAIQQDASDPARLDEVRGKLRGTLGGYGKLLEGVRDDVQDARDGTQSKKKE